MSCGCCCHHSLPTLPAATMVLTGEDKKLIQQTWGKVAGAEEEIGAEALYRYRPGDPTGDRDERVGAPRRGQWWVRMGSAPLTVPFPQDVPLLPHNQDLLPSLRPVTRL